MSKQVDPDWIGVQHRSFLAWVNNQLKVQEDFQKIEDLPTGFQTGENLVALVEIISGKTANFAIKKNPTMRIQKIQNSKIALDIVAAEKIKLINISAEDMADGKLKAILGLMWSLILRYQINKNTIAEKRKVKKIDDETRESTEEELVTVQKSDSSAKRDLLQWVQNQVKDYDVTCKDFTKSWQDGKLLTALIHSLSADAITYPPIDDPLTANTTAIHTADTKLDIPQIIDPDDITNKPEELSMMTYISYFRDYQIENAKKQPEVKKVPKVDPLQTELSGPSTTECGETATLKISAIDMDGNPKLRLDDDEMFMISIVSAQLNEPLMPMVLSQGDGTYIAEFSPPLPGLYKAYAVVNGTPIRNTPHSMNAPQRTDPIKCMLFGPGLKQDGSVKATKQTHFTIQSRDRAGDVMKIGGDNFEIKIEAGSELVANTITDNENGTYSVNYVPDIAADHIVTVTLDGRVVGPQGALTIPVTSDPKISALNSHANGPGISLWSLMTAQPTHFTIIGVDQDGKEMKNGDLTAEFDIKFASSKNNEPVQVVSQVQDNDDGTYTISYETPAISGPYALSVIINNQDLADSPFDVFVRGRIEYKESIMTGLNSLLKSDVPVEFTIRARDVQGEDIHNGGDEFNVVITYNSGEDETDTDIPAFIEDNQDGTHTVRWVPKRPGNYKITASGKNGELLKNSPVTLTMDPAPYASLSTLKPKNITRSHKGVVTADFDIELHDKFDKKHNNIKARITAHITDEEGCEIESQALLGENHSLSVKFVPTQEVYSCSVLIDGKEVGTGPVPIHLTERYLNRKAMIKTKASPYYCEAYGPGLDGANRDFISMFTVEARDENGKIMQIGESDYAYNSTLAKRLIAYQPRAFDWDTNPLLPFQDLRELRKTKRKKDRLVQQINVEEDTNIDFDEDMLMETNPCYQEVNPSYYANQRTNFPCKVQILAPSDLEKDEEHQVGLEPIILNTGPGIYTILYRPNETGEHEISVLADDQHIQKSPFTAIVAGEVDAGNSGLEGPGLKKCYVGKPTYFSIIARDSNNCDIRVGGDDFEVFLKDPLGEQTLNSIQIDDENTGTYKVSYVPAVVGVHTVSVKYRGENLRDSPFKVTAKDVNAEPHPMKCVLIGKVENGQAKKPCKYQIKLINVKGDEILSGGDIVSAVIKPQKESTTTKNYIAEFEAYVIDHGTGRYTVEFTPDFAGEYEMFINIGAEQKPINDKPFQFTVLPAVSTINSKLSNWKCNVISQKEINTNDFHIAMQTPQNVTIVPYVETKNNKLFTVFYEPPEIEQGMYDLNIQLASKNKVRGSPFHQTFAYRDHFEEEEPQQSDIFQFEAN